MGFQLGSPAFDHNAPIPPRFTADGIDVSPPLHWTGLPPVTLSLALICDDPDAPMDTWVHWVLFNIPPDMTGLAENIPRRRVLESGIRQGVNDFRKTGYGGPAPPSGIHRYFFKLYALDAMLSIDGEPTKKQLLKSMEGHVIDECILIGTYSRQRA